jgi:hypothetical protein
MDRSGRHLFHTFVKVFIILFLILIVMPFIVDQIFNSLSDGTTPGNNSIIVFKEFIVKQEVIGRFIEEIIKIVLFM